MKMIAVSAARLVAADHGFADPAPLGPALIEHVQQHVDHGRDDDQQQHQRVHLRDC